MHRAAALGLTLVLGACAAPGPGLDGAAPGDDLDEDELIEADPGALQGSARPWSPNLDATEALTPCTAEGELWLDLAPHEDHPAVVEVQAVLPEGLPFHGALRVSWTEADGSEVAFTETLDAPEDAWLGSLWGLPPETPISVDASWTRADLPGERLCLASPEIVTTGPVSAEGFPRHITHLRTEEPTRQAELDGLRFLGVMGSAQESAAFMLDARGRLLWHQDLGLPALVKGLALHPDGERLFVMGVNEYADEPGTVVSFRPTGERTEHAVAHALHHAMSFDGAGRLLVLGWEEEELHGQTVVTDTLVRLDLEAGSSEVLWRTWDSLERPEAETLSTMNGSGIYGDNQAIAYGYANGLGLDVASGTAAISLGGVPGGVITVDLEGEAPPAYLRNRSLTQEAVPGAELLPEDLLVRRAHHAWSDGTDRLLVYNRREDGVGTTVDALRWTPAEGEVEEALEIEQSIALLDETGAPTVNEHLGIAWPVDLDFARPGALMAGYHPYAGHSFTVHTAPFDPEREGLDSELLLQVSLADGESLEMIGGFMEAWSLQTLHARR